MAQQSGPHSSNLELLRTYCDALLEDYPRNNCCIANISLLNSLYVECRRTFMHDNAVPEILKLAALEGEPMATDGICNALREVDEFIAESQQSQALELPNDSRLQRLVTAMFGILPYIIFGDPVKRSLLHSSEFMASWIVSHQYSLRCADPGITAALLLILPPVLAEHFASSNRRSLSSAIIDAGRAWMETQAALDYSDNQNASIARSKFLHRCHNIYWPDSATEFDVLKQIETLESATSSLVEATSLYDCRESDRDFVMHMVGLLEVTYQTCTAEALMQGRFDVCEAISAKLNKHWNKEIAKAFFYGVLRSNQSSSWWAVRDYLPRENDKAEALSCFAKAIAALRSENLKRPEATANLVQLEGIRLYMLRQFDDAELKFREVLRIISDNCLTNEHVLKAFPAGMVALLMETRLSTAREIRPDESSSSQEYIDIVDNCRQEMRAKDHVRENDLCRILSPRVVCMQAHLLRWRRRSYWDNEMVKEISEAAAAAIEYGCKTLELFEAALDSADDFDEHIAIAQKLQMALALLMLRQLSIHGHGENIITLSERYKCRQLLRSPHLVVSNADIGNVACSGKALGSFTAAADAVICYYSLDEFSTRLEEQYSGACRVLVKTDMPDYVSNDFLIFPDCFNAADSYCLPLEAAVNELKKHHPDISMAILSLTANLSKLIDISAKKPSELEDGLSLFRLIEKLATIFGAQTLSSAASATKSSAKRQIDRLPEDAPDTTELAIDQLKGLYQKLLPSFLLPAVPADSTPSLVFAGGEKFHKLPLALMMNADGKMLFEEYDVSYAPSVEVLRRLSILSPKIPPSPSERLACVIVGNPMARDGTNLLVKASEEANAVYDCLGATTPPLVGRQATRSAVLKALWENPVVIHFACHGKASAPEFLLQLPGHIYVSADAVPAEERHLLKHWSISTGEIMKLNLSSARLVFLSLCYGGTGDVTPEGIIGLHTAFLYAGAKAVICSSKPVRDSDVTVELVKAFYSNYVENWNAAMSLNQAMREMKQKHGMEAKDDWGCFKCYSGVSRSEK